MTARRLLIDVGNSRLKWQLQEPDGRLLDSNAFVHNGQPVDDWIAKVWTPQLDPAVVVIGNVAGGRVGDALHRWIETNWRSRVLFAVSREHEFGVHNGYEIPAQLGVDRWLALIGARQHSREACAVIDCGTAVTADALGADGRHLGGVILPGVRLMHAALYRNTSLESQQQPDRIVTLGRNTRDGIWSGTVHAIAAAIDRIGDEIDSTFTEHAPIVRWLTGGNAEFLLPYLQRDYRVDPQLIFVGLSVLADKLAHPHDYHRNTPP